jgi:hypothetical protein
LKIIVSFACIREMKKIVELSVETPPRGALSNCNEENCITENDCSLHKLPLLQVVIR